MTVKFMWSFGVGRSGAGRSDSIPARDGQARVSASQSYTTSGAYGLVVDLREATTNKVLAKASVSVTIGRTRERDYHLHSCGDWKAAQRGGDGVTIDNWHMNTTAIPEGAVIDVKYHALEIPDKVKMM